MNAYDTSIYTYKLKIQHNKKLVCTERIIVEAQKS